MYLVAIIYLTEYEHYKELKMDFMFILMIIGVSIEVTELGIRLHET